MRGQVNLIDVVLTMFVLIAVMVLAPYFYQFIGMASAEADPFSAMLLQLIVPLLIVALIISIGVSARRRIR